MQKNYAEDAGFVFHVYSCCKRLAVCLNIFYSHETEFLALLLNDAFI